MEMSGFARIPGSVPVVGDIGEVWPVMAARVAAALDIKLNLMSYKQSLPAGEKFREWIVKTVKPVDRERMFKAVRQLASGSS
jgi:prophage antirepressor-like protein